MKTLFLTVAATALIFAGPSAFGADDHHHGGQPGGGHPGGAPAAHAAPAAPAHTAPTHTAAPAMTMSRSTHHGAAMNAPLTPSNSPYANGRLDHKGHNNRNNNVNRNVTNGNAFNNNNRNRGRGNNGGNGTHVTINFNRHNVTASHHFHYRGGAYRGPSGYSYHRYSYGETLPSIYWARDYWISDYSDYGLAYPPPGCVWVRYGDDAILIDEDSGEILEVVYGQFY